MLTSSPQGQDGSSITAAGAFGARILTLADRLAQFSESPDGLTCTFMSPAHRATAAELRRLMTAAGMAAQIDVVGNVVGRYASARPDAGTLIVGSHYDTVRNAGKYDGRLGILTGIVAVEELHRRHVALPFHLDVVGFSEEEGVRFSAPYLGSAAIAGRFDAGILKRRDANGLTLAEVLRQTGGTAETIAAVARRDALAGYVEVHIEQGPVLLHDNLPVGVVIAIAGFARRRVTVRGVAGHAGAVPMALRHDAAAAAAEIVNMVERRCSQVPGLMGTVGQLQVTAGAINVIPALCELSLDMRSDNAGELETALGDIGARIQAIAARRGVLVEIEKVAELPPVLCTPRLRDALGRAVARQGLAVRSLVSGPGHDAVMFDGVTDVGMLFVRCGNGGISHSPLETITASDADMGVRVLLDFLTNFEVRP
ncbi:MAG: M20 family metallo-hydrolase [Xanthobacteraceae bacterium]